MIMARLQFLVFINMPFINVKQITIISANITHNPNGICMCVCVRERLYNIYIYIYIYIIFSKSLD